MLKYIFKYTLWSKYTNTNVLAVYLQVYSFNTNCNSSKLCGIQLSVLLIPTSINVLCQNDYSYQSTLSLISVLLYINLCITCFFCLFFCAWGFQTRTQITIITLFIHVFDSIKRKHLLWQYRMLGLILLVLLIVFLSVFFIRLK